MDSILIETLKAGLQKSPNEPALVRHLADAYIAEERLNDAIALLQQCVLHHPDDSEAMQKLIDVMQNAGHKDVGVYQALQSAGSVKHNNAPEVSRVRGAKLKLVSTNSTEYDPTDDTHEQDDVIYLNDVAGMEAVKKRLTLSFLAPLKHPELSKQFGKKVSGGLLLYGPPGCGKTYIARALAGELGAKFINVGMADILDMYVGESERKLHDIFQTARRNAPCVLFFDELDALGHKRTNLKNSGMRTLVNQLLNEMDSVESNNKNVFVLGATNLPWDVDQALKRPGRFDRMVAVFPPDKVARKAIFEMNLSNTPVSGLSIDKLVDKTELYSGADIAHICQSAIENALEKSLELGQVKALDDKDFAAPLKEIKASALSWFESARNYALFANESGNFDELLEFIKAKKL
ncbi:AAA family ATPase [Alteromonas sp. AMM-1]|uniref:AAA family ATPase n=1 Tax=Alteromonas sp. AMM-1 TaxID=3394233 RepID=UPI0039A4E5AD